MKNIEKENKKYEKELKIKYKKKIDNLNKKLKNYSNLEILEEFSKADMLKTEGYGHDFAWQGLKSNILKEEILKRMQHSK